MDYMDIDQVYNVPDTPDRLAANNSNGRDCKQKEGDSSVSSHSQRTLLTNEDTRNRLKWRSKLRIDNGNSRKLNSCHGKNLSISNKSDGDSDFTISQGSSSPAKNGLLFRRTTTDKTTNYENKYSLHSQHPGKGKAVLTTQSSNCGQNTIVDLTDQRGPTQVFQNAVPNRTSEDHNDKETRQRSTSTYSFSSLGGMENPSTVAHNAYKGKEKIDDTCKGGSGIDYRKGISSDSQPTAGRSIPTSFQAISSPRVTGQKRLVRNGCISPHNIAKAKQLAENHHSGSMDAQNDKGTLAADSSSSLIRDLIAEDSSSHRGRSRMISHVSSSKEPHAKTMDFSRRHSIAHNEEANGTSNANEDSFRCLEVLGGWRSTRNRTKKIDLPVSGEVQHISRANNESLSVDQQNRNSVTRRDNGNGSGNWISDGYHGDHKTVSFQHQSAPVVSQVASPPMLQSGRFSGRRTVSSTLIKRQKQGSASTSHGECSTSTPADSEIVFLGSSKGLTSSRSATNQNGHGLNISDPVIEIDEFSPEIRNSSSSNVVTSSNDDSGARARQLEADEMLARELQEQLYNEELGVGDGVIDAHVALALQEEEASQPGFSNRSHPVFHPRGSVISNFYRQFQSRSSQNPSVRRGALARGPTSARLTRLRSRLPSRSPRMSYRERSSVFPTDMDLDMRMHILEALEAFNDMGMDGSFLQVEREFNENDYEMLLALDENNHQHGGATPDQINRLPQSTVQGGNFDEACAICLETPSSGEIIRHLPCLHKFHKDCIDPWLGRRTSCPVCKSSIT